MIMNFPISSNVVIQVGDYYSPPIVDNSDFKNVPIELIEMIVEFGGIKVYRKLLTYSKFARKTMNEDYNKKFRILFTICKIREIIYRDIENYLLWDLTSGDNQANGNSGGNVTIKTRSKSQSRCGA